MNDLTRRYADTLDEIRDAGLFKAEQTYELQALGVVLGDAFVQELDAKWVIVNDPFGRNAAVQIPGTTVYLFAVTMIQKRVEEGEDMDVQAFFHAVTQQAKQMKADPSRKLRVATILVMEQMKKKRMAS